MTDHEITIKGNPACPTGECGQQMLQRMNQSHDEVTNWGLSFLTLPQPKEILEIGCGGGATLGRLHTKFEQAQITGVDYSSVSVEQSLKWNRSLGEKGIVKVIEGSVEAMPFEENQFDAIVTVESFYFWPKPKENLKEVCRVLKPKGQFLLIADIYDNGNLSDHAKENVQMFHMTNPTKDQFYDLFKVAGFSSVRIETKDPWICVRGEKE